MNLFREMGLPTLLNDALDRLSFTQPTPIQAQAIPLALQDKDILGSAQTGTGKTLAFIIPLLVRLMKSEQETALVLTPTRELAQQVMNIVLQLLGNNPAIKAALLIGGEPIFKQFSQLRARPRLIIGTPGRVIDHLDRKTVNFSMTRFLVLDETDRMLDMGFEIQLEQILKFVPKDRQTLLFSATVPSRIAKLAEKYQNTPTRISVGSTTAPAEKIKQEIMYVKEFDKYENLINQLDQRTGSIIVFVKTKFGAKNLADKLSRANHSASAIHGNLRQSKRDQVINDFRKGRHRIMVATDIAARGLDIPHIQHVINYDLPQVPEDYIHRIGRTGRAGAEGSSLCLVTPQDTRKWKAIHLLIRPTLSDNYVESVGIKSTRTQSDRPQAAEGEERRSERPRFDRPKFGNREDRPFNNNRRFESRERSFTPRDKDAASEEGASSFPKKRSFSRPFDSNSSRPSSYSKRPPFGGRSENPGEFEDKKRFYSNVEFDRPKFGNRERSKDVEFGGEERSERPSFGDRPSRPFDRPRTSGFRSNSSTGFRSDRPRSDRPSFGSNRPGFEGKKRFSRDTDSSGISTFGERPSFGSDRSEFGGFKKKFSDSFKSEGRSEDARPSRADRPGFENRRSSSEGKSFGGRPDFARKSSGGGYKGNSSSGRPFNKSKGGYKGNKESTLPA